MKKTLKVFTIFFFLMIVFRSFTEEGPIAGLVSKDLDEGSIIARPAITQTNVQKDMEATGSKKKKKSNSMLPIYNDTKTCFEKMSDLEKYFESEHSREIDIQNNHYTYQDEELRVQRYFEVSPEGRPLVHIRFFKLDDEGLPYIVKMEGEWPMDWEKIQEKLSNEGGQLKKSHETGVFISSQGREFPFVKQDGAYQYMEGPNSQRVDCR
jgi:hypothetical protein